MIRFSSLLLPIAAALAMLMLSADSGAQPGQAPSPGGSGSFEVGGVDVDVSAKNGTAARNAGWRMAQRKGWQMLSRRMGGGGGTLSDSALDSIVSGIVIEREEIGPTRYIARLGVLFDRGRAAAILGVSGQLTRSPPMLVLPVEWSGGVATVFERRSAWHEAWARFRTGNSTIDYVRPSGTGADSLLFNAGQINRNGRGWWRTVLEQYGASDVVIPIVHIFRQYPGGPIVGRFQARYGPDNRLLTQFSLRVGNGDALPALLDAGIKRIDLAYQSALSSGVLKVDPGLTFRLPTAEPTPEAEADSVAGEEAVVVDDGTGQIINVQIETPSVTAVESAEASVRGIPGVRSAVTTSLALGGISVMRVAYRGDVSALKSALEARGWQVTVGSGAIRIQRGRPSQGQPQLPSPGQSPGLPPPGVTAENATG